MKWRGNEMTESIIIKETSCTFAPETFLTGKLETIINVLTDFKEEGEWEGIESIDVGDYGDPEYCLYKHRPETDEEYKLRMEMLKEREDQLIKQQKRQKILAKLTDEEKELLGVK